MQAEHALGLRKLNGHTGEMAPLVAWRPHGAAAARGPIPTGA